MRWGETIMLIKTPEQDPEIDAAGYPIPQPETARTVYCDVRSVGRSEFYQAYQAGVSADIIAVVRATDYQGERSARLQETIYTILRAYRRDSEYIELTLSDTRKLPGNKEAF